MNIDIREIDSDYESLEMEFNIVDVDNNETVGYLFVARVCEETHIAYEVWEEYRGNDVATNALKMITERLSRPVLEIARDNMASKRVAMKAGYTLVKSNVYFDIYEFYDNKKIKQFIR